MIKTVCDCCGAETFKKDLYVDTNIGVLGRKVTLCPDCAESVVKECEEAENNIRNAVRAASRGIISDVFRRFEALNTVEMFGNDNAAPLTDGDIDSVIVRIVRGKSRIEAQTGSFNPQNGITLVGSGLNNMSSVYSGISIDKDYLKDTVSEIICEMNEKSNKMIHTVKIKPDDV